MASRIDFSWRCSISSSSSWWTAYPKHAKCVNACVSISSDPFSALRAIPSLRPVLTAFGGYVLITSRFVCDSCSFHHDSSAKLILAYQTLIDPLIQRLLAFASSSIILCILCHALCLITIKRRILLAYGSGRLDPSISNA